jgi:hypothetical protein
MEFLGFIGLLGLINSNVTFNRQVSVLPKLYNAVLLYVL